MARLLARLARAREGGAAVEFALIAPVLLAAVVGTVEIGRLLWVRHTLQTAVEEAARFAIANGAATAQQLVDRAKARLPGLDPAKVSVAVASDAVGGLSYVTITASYAFAPAAALVPIAPVTLTGRERVPLIP